MRCLSCQYDLRKLSENRCPECGREFDPNDAATFDSGRYKPPPTTVLVTMGICLSVVLGIACFIGFSNDQPQLFIVSAVGLLSSAAIAAVFGLFHIVHFAFWKLRRLRR